MTSEHVREAQKHIDEIHECQSLEGATDATLLASGFVAVAESNLAIAEQQRVANLIALGQYRIEPDKMSHHRTVIYAPPESEYDITLRDDIREALGIEKINKEASK